MRTQQEIEIEIQRRIITGHRELKEGNTNIEQFLTEITTLAWVLHEGSAWHNVAQAVRYQAFRSWDDMSKNHETIDKIAELIKANSR